MKMRDVVLQTRYSVNDSGTWTFNINLVDPVTEFKLWFRVDNNATGPNEAGCIPYLIDEIAIIDGSEVIASLNGAEAVALTCFDFGRSPYMRHQEAGGMGQNWCIPIHFGRSLTDEQWIFDPTKFRNPQLRITWDLEAVAAVGANAYATGTLNITVWAKVMEEGAAPIGYLMSKEIKDFTSAASGNEITYLPTDFDIRKVMIRTYKKAGAMETCLSNIKISQDEDKWIPVDLDTNDFKALMLDWFDEVEFSLRCAGDDGEVREHYQDAGARGQAVAGETDVILGLTGYATNTFIPRLIDNAGAGVTEVQYWVNSRGVYPFSCFCYPFGDQQDPQDWLKVANMGNLRLILTQATADYKIEIVTQQAHRY